MLLRSSRAAQNLEKEAVIGTIRKGWQAFQAARKAAPMAVRSPTAHAIRSWNPTSRMGRAAKSVGGAAASVGERGLGTAWKSWKPTSGMGRAAKWMGSNKLKTVGLAGATYLGGAAISKGVGSAVAKHNDPYAFQRRRMQGFRSQT